LQERLAEWLHEARLGEDTTLRQQARDLAVRHAPEQADPLAPLQPRPEGTVTCKGERPFAETREGVGEADDVLPLVERADAEEAGRPGWWVGDREALAVDAARHDLHLA